MSRCWSYPPPPPRQPSRSPRARMRRHGGAAGRMGRHLPQPGNAGRTAAVGADGRAEPGMVRTRSAPFSPASEICTIDPPDHQTGACNGDSGGPLLVAEPSAVGGMVQIGVASHGYNECATTSPSVFTRVDAISAWVRGWAQALASAPPASASLPAGLVAAPTLAGVASSRSVRLRRRALARARLRQRRRSLLGQRPGNDHGARGAHRAARRQADRIQAHPQATLANVTSRSRPGEHLGPLGTLPPEPQRCCPVSAAERSR